MEVEKNISTNLEEGKEENFEPKKKKAIIFRISGNFLLIIALIILILISGAQAVELNNLKEKIATGEVQSATSSSTTSGTDTKTPQNLQNLPSMVGGC